MSGRITTPARASAAGAAKAAANSVPSAAVSVRVPRSATSPVRGGAGGRLSWSWHMPGVLPPAGLRRRPRVHSVLAGLVGSLGASAEDGGGDVPAGVGQPVVLPIGLLDQPVQLGLVQPVLDLGDLAQRLEAAALATHR